MSARQARQAVSVVTDEEVPAMRRDPRHDAKSGEREHDQSGADTTELACCTSGVLRGDADSQSLLEELFHVIWECEAEWRLDDKIDLAMKVGNKRAATPRRGRPRVGE
jgi:hypothetical protein